MAKHIKTLLTTALLLLCASVNHAALRVDAPVSEEKTERLSVEEAETGFATTWAGRKWEKLKKRMARKRANWEKRQAKRKANRGDGGEGGIPWYSLTFVLGIVFLVGGIILGIAAFSSPLGGFFHLLAGLLVVAGIVMMLFAVLRAGGG